MSVKKRSGSVITRRHVATKLASASVIVEPL
jgi:hypothetical protein